MHRPILALVIVALFLLPAAAQAAGPWTTTATLPSSFRPNRSVTFSFTASSTSPTDLPVDWFVDLFTCTDSNANGYCSSNEPNYVSHGRRTLQATPGNSASVTWSVNLAEPEGTRRYHFSTLCRNNPCLTEPAGGDYNKTGNFQLAYTNTWTRQIIATSPTSVGTSQTVTYRMTSTSVDDRDLSGTTELYSRPPGQAETSMGAKPYTANANAVTNVQWTSVAFPAIGAHQLRTTDTNAADTTLTVTVRGVHLHILQPRTTYPEGARVSLYFTVEGHGSTPDPAPIANQDIQLTVKNGSYTLATATIGTDATGRAYANISTPNDAVLLTWTATTSGTWLGIAYSLTQPGEIAFTPAAVGDHAALEENVTAIRENLSEVQLKGVHLDDVGSRNLWMTSLRAVGAVALVIILAFLILFVIWKH